ncbi:MAG: putative N-acyltransferase [Flavobacteriales bacterium]
MTVEPRCIYSISEIDAQQWDALWPSDYPFIKHAFLLALEQSGAVCQKQGWQPQHLLLEAEGQVVAAMPLYLKTHSYGEYVFDWSWADAYERSGLSYYPKLLCAIPFTPSCGPRLGFCSSDVSVRERLAKRLMSALKEHALATSVSSTHVLFPNAESKRLLDFEGYILRESCQYQWFNLDYTSFDDYLNSFSSRKRKSIRKERQKIANLALDFEWKHGTEITHSDWQSFYILYHQTYLKRSGRAGYLGQSFFYQLGQGLPANVALLQVKREGEIIAAALFLRDSSTLYGRYWGALEELDGLHFETCYYQGIDYAIAQGLKRFDSGAQGEHKIQRGFRPVRTLSYHSVAHPDFSRAISEFCVDEKTHIQAYIEDAQRYLPFKEGQPSVDPDILNGTDNASD